MIDAVVLERLDQIRYEGVSDDAKAERSSAARSIEILAGAVLGLEERIQRLEEQAVIDSARQPDGAKRRASAGVHSRRGKVRRRSF